MLSDRKREYKEKQRSLATSFLAGAAAGFVVDVALFPLDTCKTRLQCQDGFWKSGGFSGIYKGLGPTAIGSAPCAAVFFATYNGFKYACEPYVKRGQESLVHITAAAIGEWAACVLRVPTEIVKQRRQACYNEGSALRIVRNTLKHQGILGLYQGFWTTVLRDVPFAVIQFPLWEYFKYKYSIVWKKNKPVQPNEGAVCGAIAGAMAGAVTTPLDVIKTRIMLSETSTGQQVKVMPIMLQIYRGRGISGFFAGFWPRVAWIFIGGFIFFGVYEHTCALIECDSQPKK